MLFLDVAFLPSQASVFTTFVKNCCTGYRSATCLRSVVGGKQGHAICEMILLRYFLFLRESNFIEINIITKMRQIWPPTVFGEITGFNTMVPARYPQATKASHIHLFIH